MMMLVFPAQPRCTSTDQQCWNMFGRNCFFPLHKRDNLQQLSNDYKWLASASAGAAVSKVFAASDWNVSATPTVIKRSPPPSNISRKHDSENCPPQQQKFSTHEKFRGFDKHSFQRIQPCQILAESNGSTPPVPFRSFCAETSPSLSASSETKSSFLASSNSSLSETPPQSSRKSSLSSLSSLPSSPLSPASSPLSPHDTNVKIPQRKLTDFSITALLGSKHNADSQSCHPQNLTTRVKTIQNKHEVIRGCPDYRANPKESEIYLRRSISKDEFNCKTKNYQNIFNDMKNYKSVVIWQSQTILDKNIDELKVVGRSQLRSHPSQDKSAEIYACSHCDRRYTTSGALKMHIRTHTLPCHCDICGKSFSRPWLLQGHMRTHSGEKPFKCSDCGRSFADKSNLRAHSQTHSQVKRYKCSSCEKSFSRLPLLTRHKFNCS